MGHPAGIRLSSGLWVGAAGLSAESSSVTGYRFSQGSQGMSSFGTSARQFQRVRGEFRRRRRRHFGLRMLILLVVIAALGYGAMQLYQKRQFAAFSHGVSSGASTTTGSGPVQVQLQR